MEKFYLFILILVFSSCAVETEQIFDPTETINGLWDEFIAHWESGNADACVEIYHEDLIYIAPETEVITNRQEIRDFYNFLFESHQRSMYNHKGISLDFCGSHAIEYSHFIVDWLTHEGHSWTYHARAVAKWTPDSDGNWKTSKLIFNPAPSEEVEAAEEQNL
jgi:ketosteroid isomerase-like protein